MSTTTAAATFKSYPQSQSITMKKLLFIGTAFMMVFAIMNWKKDGGWMINETDVTNYVTGSDNSSSLRSSGLKKAANLLKEAVLKSKTINEYDSAGLPFQKKTIPSDKKYDVCIVGAGLSGAVIAERYASILDKTSLVMDLRTHIGGNCYDFREPHSGIMMNLYGAHLFHTSLDRVYKYITKWQDSTPWKRYDHTVVGWLKDKLLPIPVNINTVNGLFDSHIQTSAEMDEWLKSVQIPCEGGECKNAEEMAVSRVGKDLFDTVFKTYTKKQWDKEPKELDALVTARIPVRNDFDPRYFADKYQLLPSKGYTAWFAQVLKHRNIDVVLGIDYFDVVKSLEGRCGKTIFTGPIDGYFANSGLGKLEYRSINFEADIIQNKGFFQTHSVVNYPGPEVDFTRIVEYKHYFHQESDYTVTVKEYSTDKGDPYYPVPNPANHELYEKYRELAQKEEEQKNVYFVGRLASYKYFNMDAAIDNALNMFNTIEKHPSQPDIEDGNQEAQTQQKASTVSDSV
eukprot:CAMPEP_0194175164 /NCGR_PEP_ID=MMETSP0154-20130528/9247_1 /TAXON_ID=1049557 /ORGANISM="Thalassiothrix antarctica, Strain L6-D1" /LENGTH=511 /DNA_ID=CAMNT_0038888875 /DNA_START=13 /DNA_END=1548 /DNA_ORIENTATION=+